MSNSEYNSECIPEEFKKYIIYKYGSFAIKAKLTNHITTFGRFSSQDVACAATKLLIDHDWDIRDVSKEPLSEYGNYYIHIGRLYHPCLSPYADYYSYHIHS